MKKVCSSIVCVLMLTVLLSLCSCSSGSLPEGFEEAQVIAKAQQVVTLLTDGDYDGVVGLFSAQMKASTDAKGLKDALGGMLDTLGDFKEFKSQATAGKNDATIGDYAVVVLVCTYENGSATYTISVDADGNVCGLYMK